MMDALRISDQFDLFDRNSDKDDDASAVLDHGITSNATNPEPVCHVAPKARRRRSSLERAMRAAYSIQKRNAKQRGIGWEFTFLTWSEFWLVDDRWSKRGNHKDQLMMCRLNDAGAYSPTNVYAGTSKQNSHDIPQDKRSAFMKAAWDRRMESGAGCHLSDRARHPRRKAVSTPDGIFNSAALAAEHYGFTRQYASLKARSNADGWAFVEHH